MVFAVAGVCCINPVLRACNTHLMLFETFPKMLSFYFRGGEEWYTEDRLVGLACTMAEQEEEGRIVMDGRHTEFIQIDRREFTDHDTKKQTICGPKQSLHNNQC